MLWSNKTKKLEQAEIVHLEGSPEVTVQLRPSPRAKRLSLRVSRLDGRVTLSVPHGASRKEAIRFAQERADWIRKHLRDVAPLSRPAIGGRIHFNGEVHPINEAPVKAARISSGAILVPSGDERQTSARIEALLKREARVRLISATEIYAAQVGRPFGRITIRDTRSRWGSCSSEGNLNYSWRLAMAPALVLDYVAAHEVAHLVHMDHSSAFWAQVGEICPDYPVFRKWLRDNGSQLHRYKFRD
jgi:predicted metal-dependent hydrolase